jgi:cytochrome c oxidase subunit III
MPAAITRKPGKTRKQRKEPAFGGQPPVLRHPTGGGGDEGDGGNNGWGGDGPRGLLLRVRSFVFSVLAADFLFFAVLVAIFFARQTSAPVDSLAHPLGWHPLALPPILFLNTAFLLLSCFFMELARRAIFREIDVFEEWLGLGRPAFRRALPWMMAAFALGSLFVAGQWTAWKQLAVRGSALDALSAPAGYFFSAVTGLHAAHVLLGLAALLFCLGALNLFRRIDFRQIAIDATAWYWHAMGALWLLLMAVLACGK